MIKKLRAAILTVLLLTFSTALPSAADAGGPQAEIDALIAQYGGIQTSADTISWDEGAVTLVIRDNAQPYAIDSCPTGRFCAFQRAYFQGSIMSFSACPGTYTDFSPLGGKPGSIAHKRSTGTVRAYANTTLKATLLPGQSSASLTGITKITCA
ncbi:peptidase inhibitor family I36 protein [Tessaracoccus sp. MC1865]|uniref:peptidase inhibitor family I36 protein n=1 Tax=Tessaracoccus sp. MC1865 TaxID=2760310 RepID=UPI0015FFDE10|nr:peptidase inhibitor family I36 protein [Tessaracoccus sp. MC1865]MBB1484988.1 peptidase inhibitor family I36 protein [Tessaracoccus sp. MC1865]MDO5676360.1 peptidase inhibitor family I36 protein [Propionibacteriaceae bacterium]QTO38666.1 peptidase inhibitor family I36 protein [Tessaracoccus sp. MC1865]